MRQVSKRGRKNDLQLEFVDIRSVLDAVGVSYSESGKNVSNGWVGVQCPMPGCGDISNHMGINLGSPVISCYNCGTTGNYLTYLAAEVGSWGKAIDILKEHTPRELKVYSDIGQEGLVTHVDLPPEATKIPTKYHIQYLKGRGFDPKKLDVIYDLYYCGPSGDWANRIIAPIYSRNKLITFTSIDIAKDSYLRYKHLSKEKSIIHCKNHLYGIEQAVGRSVLTVEGYFDKLRIGPGCICTFGTQTTPQQLKLLSRFSKVFIAFDGDSPGRIAAKKLGYNLSAFTEVEIIHLPEGKDPDTLDPKDIKELQNMVKTKW